MKSQRPSLLQIFRTDYAAFMALVFPVVFWAMAIFLNYNQPPADTGLLYIGISLTAAAVPLILWRIYYFLKIFDIGVEAAGVIQGVGFYRSRGRVNYIYTYQGTRFSAGNPIIRNKRTKELAAGQEVTVLVNPNNPKRAVIKHLFL